MRDEVLPRAVAMEPAPALDAAVGVPQQQQAAAAIDTGRGSGQGAGLGHARVYGGVRVGLATGYVFRHLSIVLLLTLWAAPVSAQWARAQAWGGNTQASGGGTITYVYPTDITAGELLVCFGWSDNNTPTLTFADDVNGAWTAFPTVSPVTGVGRVAAAYFPNAGAGTTTVTLTYSSQPTNRVIACGAYDGIATTSPFDVGASQAQTNPGTGTDAVSTGATGTTAQDNSLAVAFTLVEEPSVTITPNGSWSSAASNTTSFSWNVMDRNISPTGTVTGLWTINSASGDPMSIVGVFKEPAGGGGAVPASRFLLFGVGP